MVYSTIDEDSHTNNIIPTRGFGSAYWQNKGKILFGVLKEDIITHRRGNPISYIIGKIESKRKIVQKTKEEIRIENKGDSRTQAAMYKHLFGFNEPSEEVIKQFLLKLHGLKEEKTKTWEKTYDLVPQTPSELSYPLDPKIFEIYKAARDSGTFEEIGFLELRKIEQKIDPLLYGTILGGLKVPLAYWK